MAVEEMPLARSSGVLLHISSLPGKYGIGDLGQAARAFVDYLHQSGQTYWQILPLGPTGFGDSPYQCLSSFAGNANFICLDELVDPTTSEPWLSREALADTPGFRQRRVNYETVIPWHDEMLSLAYEGFLVYGDGQQKQAFDRFCQEQAHWLDDFALYLALKESHQLRPWVHWPRGEAFRGPIEMKAAQEKHRSRLDEHRFRQWLFFRQWRQLRDYANRRGIRLIGDIPIYVGHDSCDVWVHRDLFDLDAEGQPRVVAGVPPDYFSPTGQLWGNPIYLWKEHKKSGYDWWIKRLLATLELVDLVRIDHFRAFYDYWQVPAAASTALDGTWLLGPQDELFLPLRQALEQALKRDVRQLIIAEDLGDSMQAVIDWREQLGLAGMKILQFAFGDNEEEKRRFKPVKYTADQPGEFSILYIGTHDNNTALGWWHNEARDHNRQAVKDAIRIWKSDSSAEIVEPNWELIQLGMESRECVFIVPLQDLLGAGSSSRMNSPGVAAGNWRWRCTRQEMDRADMWDRLHDLTRRSGRLPAKLADSGR